MYTSVEPMRHLLRSDLMSCTEGPVILWDLCCPVGGLAKQLRCLGLAYTYCTYLWLTRPLISSWITCETHLMSSREQSSLTSGCSPSTNTRMLEATMPLFLSREPICLPAQWRCDAMGASRVDNPLFGSINNSRLKVRHIGTHKNRNEVWLRPVNNSLSFKSDFGEWQWEWKWQCSRCVEWNRLTELVMYIAGHHTWIVLVVDCWQ